jgi:hypothetical protein
LWFRERLFKYPFIHQDYIEHLFFTKNRIFENFLHFFLVASSVEDRYFFHNISIYGCADDDQILIYIVLLLICSFKTNLKFFHYMVENILYGMFLFVTFFFGRTLNNTALLIIIPV